MARTPLRMLTRRDLRERKGVPWSRQRLHEKIKNGEFPPPDGKTTDDPQRAELVVRNDSRPLAQRARAQDGRRPRGRYAACRADATAGGCMN